MRSKRAGVVRNLQGQRSPVAIAAAAALVLVVAGDAAAQFVPYSQKEYQDLTDEAMKAVDRCDGSHVRQVQLMRRNAEALKAAVKSGIVGKEAEQDANSLEFNATIVEIASSYCVKFMGRGFPFYRGGPDPNISGFQVAGKVARMLEAAKPCDAVAYTRAIGELISRAVVLETGAPSAKGPIPGIMRAEAGQLRAFADFLKAKLDECQKPGTAPSADAPPAAPRQGAPAPGPGATPAGPTPPGPGMPVTPPRPGTPEFGHFRPPPGVNDNVLWGEYFVVEPDNNFAQGSSFFRADIGPNFGSTRRPRTSFGTFFDPSTGTEQRVDETCGRCSGTGARVSLTAEGPVVKDPGWFFGRRSSAASAGARQYAARDLGLAQLRALPIARLAARWRFSLDVDWYRYSASQNTGFAPGTFNVAHTFIAPNPATGTTGILLGATGDQISVKSRGDEVNIVANAIVTQPHPGPFGVGEVWYWQLGAGARLGLRWDGHEITQQSGTFSGITMTTDLSTNEVFFGPNLVAGAGIDRGDIFVAASAYVSPGVLFIGGKAKQTSLCNLCPLAGDRNVAQELSFDETKFAVKVGVEVKGGLRFTRNFALEAAFGFHHTSHTGAVHNPITPNQQPAALFTSTTNTIVGSIRAVVRW